MLLDTPTVYLYAYCNRTVADYSLCAELQCTMFRACHPEVGEVTVRAMSLCWVMYHCLKVDLLSDHFVSKQSRESVDLPVTCHHFPSRITFAFRSSEVRRLLLYLDPYGGADPYPIFTFFSEDN